MIKVSKAIILHAFLIAFFFMIKPVIKRNTIQLNGDNKKDSMPDATWCKIQKLKIKAA